MSKRAPKKIASQVLSRNQTALLTWAFAYPLITSLLLILEPLVRDLALPLRTFILTALMVPIMVYWALPAAMQTWANRVRARQS